MSNDSESDSSPRMMLGVLALLGALVAWSSWAIVARWSFAHSNLNSWDLGFLRFLFAGLCMLPWLIRQGWQGLSWSTIFLLAFCAGPGYVAFAYTGLEFAPSAHGAALTAGMLPLFTTALAIWMKQTRLTVTLAIGLLLIFLAAMAFFRDGFNESGKLIWLGDLILICGPAVWATYTVKIKQEQIDPLHATAIVSVVGFVMYLPVYFTVGSPGQLLETSLTVLLFQGLFHGVIVVVLALTFYSYAVRKLGPAITTMSLSVVPGVTAVAAFLILSEPFSQWSAAGVVLDGLGIICVVLAAKQQKRNQIETAESFPD